MKKSSILFSTFCLLAICLLFACQSSSPKSGETGAAKKEVAQVTETVNNRSTYENIDVSAFQKKMKEDKVIILDVRTPAETKMGIIEGAMEIDIRQNGFKEKIEQLDKNNTYLVYCKSGGRSSSACEIMAEAGFKNLYNLEGGYTTWSKE